MEWREKDITDAAECSLETTQLASHSIKHR